MRGGEVLPGQPGEPEEPPVGEPLKLQIEDFILSVRSGRRPTVDAQAGFAAVHTAERIVEACRELVGHA